MTRGGDPPSDPPPSSDSGSGLPSSVPPRNPHNYQHHIGRNTSPVVEDPRLDDLLPPRPPPLTQQHRRYSQKDPPGFYVKQNQHHLQSDEGGSNSVCSSLLVLISDDGCAAMQAAHTPHVAEPVRNAQSGEEEGGSNSVSSSLLVLISDQDCAAMQAAHRQRPHVEKRNEHNTSEQHGPTMPSGTAEPAISSSTKPTHIPLQLSEHEKHFDDSLVVWVPSEDCETLRQNDGNERHRKLGGNQQQVRVELELERQSILDQQIKLPQSLEQQSQDEDNMMVMVPSDECVIMNPNEVQERHIHLGGNQQLQPLQAKESINAGHTSVPSNRQQISMEDRLGNESISSSTSSNVAPVSKNKWRVHRADPPSNNDEILDDGVQMGEGHIGDEQLSMADMSVESSQQQVIPEEQSGHVSITCLAKSASKVARFSKNNPKVIRADPPTIDEILGGDDGKERETPVYGLKTEPASSFSPNERKGNGADPPSCQKESKSPATQLESENQSSSSLVNLPAAHRKQREKQRSAETDASLSESFPFQLADRGLERDYDDVDMNALNEAKTGRLNTTATNISKEISAATIAKNPSTVLINGRKSSGKKESNLSKQHPTVEQIPDDDAEILTGTTEQQVVVTHKSKNAVAPRDAPFGHSVDSSSGKSHYLTTRHKLIESLTDLPSGLADEKESAIPMEQVKNVTPISTNTETPKNLASHQDKVNVQDNNYDDPILNQSVIMLNTLPGRLVDPSIGMGNHENRCRSLEETKEPLAVEEPGCCLPKIYTTQHERTVNLYRPHFDRHSGSSVESFDQHSKEECKEPIDDDFPSVLGSVDLESGDHDAWFPSGNEATPSLDAIAAALTTSVRDSIAPITHGVASENLLTSSSGSLRVLNLAPCDTEPQHAERNELPIDTSHECMPPVVWDSLNFHHNRLSSSVRSINDSRSRIPPSQQGVPDPTDVPTKHGAYYVVKVTPPGIDTYDVLAPDGYGPGDIFLAEAGSRLAEVVVPDDYVPGEPLEFQCPKDSITTYKPLKLPYLTASPAAEAAWNKQLALGCRPMISMGGAFLMHGPIREINEIAMRAGKSVARTHIVTVPDGVRPGVVFQASANGFTFQATCPVDIPDDRRIRIVPPPPPPEPPKAMQYFRVQVPPGIKAGDQFAAIIDNSHERLEVLVECPQGRAGKTITVSLPTQTVVGKIALAYESHRRSGWRRTVRASDLQFQWVRMRRESAITESVASFDFFKSAFVRQVILLEGHDPRLCTASLRLVPAPEAVTASKLRLNGKTIISYADLAKQQVCPLAEKHEWFLGICRELTQLHHSTDLSINPGVVVNDVYVEIFVRRAHLLRDGMRGVLSLSVAQMQANWRIRWLGEPALDDGGLTKEFFHLVTEELLDPSTGLFVGESVVDINPFSVNEGSKCQDTALMYYRFAGRLLGRALFSNHQIKGHLVRTLYKHLLGWPLTYEDVHDQDEEFYNSCKKLAEGIDVPELYFSITEIVNGKHIDIGLIDGGADIEVTSENCAEYLEARLRYKVFDRILPQLTELLLGFYDVMPEPALTVFDAGELELLLCGLPIIDVEDWKTHTEYTGVFEKLGCADSVVKWFWELVEEFDAEMRARLLQFATGTSSVPSSGFKGLCGHNGRPQKFTLNGVADSNTCYYPKSHTCFNRIDCQRYKSKKLLKERLTVSITVSYVGFNDE